MRFETGGRWELSRVDRKSERSDADEFWDDIGLDLDSLGPRGQAVAGAVTGGAVLLGVVLVFALIPQFFWLVFIFGWLLFPALGALARGLAGMADSGGAGGGDRRLGERERELLEALGAGGELSPAQAALQTSLTVSEADELLGRLAGEGHLRVRGRSGGLFYSLWEVEPGDFEDREALER